MSDDLRAALHQQWAGVAPAWSDGADEIDEHNAGTAAAMLALAKIRPGERVLELACGPGGVGLEAAPLADPGEVVLSDVAVEMAEIAAARAAARGLTNVTTRVLDLEAIDEPDAAYDVVLCREGLMLVVDPARAAREIARVLRPGGRASIAVWGARERNPWLGTLFDAVGEQLSAPIPPPGVPGPFSLPSLDVLVGLLRGAGLENVRGREVDAPFRPRSLDAWWERVPNIAGPVAKMLAGMPADAVGAIRERAIAELAAYAGPHGVEIPGLTLVAGGRR
ncbi:class I SAM-dependent methyltransferase [Capillimicrobium parvum]|uniref:2-methoxy-6-polyprenyl-1,4-benzoquinol methylase, mitochondrial n=1 Tax=Capillimicrobium parvum TaxID=2884022 RepID=A0A9E7C2I1_9ACTN|nr:methyltransferase domain-containing protein [Capillimicrobium parvum]UGS37468.1 2-methoxy-6-polyprenyl-1,4-benzoquinol methylase, mitochondrial [Capillimicrobium parvum]